MQTRLNHIRANVQDLQKAVDWYCTTLGFEVKALWPPDLPIYAEFVAKEGAAFSIAVAQPVPTGARFNFSVGDVDVLWESLKDKAEIVEPLFDTPYGTRKFTIRDIDGNELGFVRG